MVTIVAKKTESNSTQHVLVPKHTKLTQSEKKELVDKYKISIKYLPRISIKDPAIAGMDLTTEDVVKVERASPTSKNTVFYRRVVK